MWLEPPAHRTEPLPLGPRNSTVSLRCSAWQGAGYLPLVTTWQGVHLQSGRHGIEPRFSPSVPGEEGPATGWCGKFDQRFLSTCGSTGSNPHFPRQCEEWKARCMYTVSGCGKFDARLLSQCVSAGSNPHFPVSARSGRPDVYILWLDDVASLTRDFYPSVAETGSNPLFPSVRGKVGVRSCADTLR